MTFCCTAATQLVPMSYCPKTRTWPNADLPSSHVNPGRGLCLGRRFLGTDLRLGCRAKACGVLGAHRSTAAWRAYHAGACYERLNDENGIKQLYEYYVAHSDSVADERCIPILKSMVGKSGWPQSVQNILRNYHEHDSVGKSLHDS